MAPQVGGTPFLQHPLPIPGLQAVPGYGWGRQEPKFSISQCCV